MPNYRITDKAGPFVAGRASTGAGETIFATEREAAHDLRVGALELPEAKGEKKKGGPAAK